jgi:hypothetical protein
LPPPTAHAESRYRHVDFPSFSSHQKPPTCNKVESQTKKENKSCCVHSFFGPGERIVKIFSVRHSVVVELATRTKSFLTASRFGDFWWKFLAVFLVGGKLEEIERKIEKN